MFKDTIEMAEWWNRPLEPVYPVVFIMSRETIYQSLYVQGRGALKRELTQCLRTGRALRKPRRKLGERCGRLAAMVSIS